MDEKTLELLTYLKDLVKTKGEFAQKQRQLLHSLLDNKGVHKASDMKEGHLGELGQS